MVINICESKKVISCNFLNFFQNFINLFTGFQTGLSKYRHFSLRHFIYLHKLLANTFLIPDSSGALDDHHHHHHEDMLIKCLQLIEYLGACKFLQIRQQFLLDSLFFVCSVIFVTLFLYFFSCSWELRIHLKNFFINLIFQGSIKLSI